LAGDISFIFGYYLTLNYIIFIYNVENIGAVVFEKKLNFNFGGGGGVAHGVYNCTREFVVQRTPDWVRFVTAPISSIYIL
jgi:hypothetical protein